MKTEYAQLIEQATRYANEVGQANSQLKREENELERLNAL